MLFEQVLPLLREGKMIRRDIWPEHRALYRKGGIIYMQEYDPVLRDYGGIEQGVYANLYLTDILADDWRELV